MASSHPTEAAGPQYSRCLSIRHTRAQFREEEPYLRRRAPRDDFSERKEFRPNFPRCALANPVSTPAQAKGTERGLHALSPRILNALVPAAIVTQSASEFVPVDLITNDRHLDAPKQFLALFESKPDLLRRQIGNRSRDRADFVRGGPFGAQGSLYPNRPFHGVPSFER
jgi:hypothetical protein